MHHLNRLTDEEVRKLEQAYSDCKLIHDHLTAKCAEQFERIIRLEEENRILRERLQAPDASLTAKEVELRHVETVLKSVNGNKARAAKILGFNRRTLYRRLGR